MTHPRLSSKYSWPNLKEKHSSWNQVNYSTDLCNEVESLICISQIQKEQFSSKERTFKRSTSPPDADFQPVCLSARRPKLVRGFYLGKEPLYHHQTSSKFEFFHQGKKNTRQEGDRMKPLKRNILFPGSLAVQMCRLQTREGTIRETETRVNSAGSSTAARVSFAGPRSEEVNSSLASIPKQNATLIGQTTTATTRKPKQINLKATRTSSKCAKSGKRETMWHNKDHTENKAFGLKGIHEDRERFTCVPDKGRLNRLGKFLVPDFPDECFTFKISDYNIWSRVREP